ncbi:transcriptional regulator [Staphylococcus microti]|uniref:Putative DNA binding protein n=1 Tax=Staphylococcus microti TaxID=569857 RepID=A0A0D6XRQ4_9STAP|nr:HTH domain-containing protein [Staphylococcus microti]KIX91484.1 transcriptional regulator [Staphylococcus microti]PNZ77544.1 HTH domain-containing protein [Staphylococcus microti]SUM56426.1 putative DNA binding protein [Staphylococcus microti]
MDRAFRILTIYNLLLQHKAVNKKALVLELNSSPRTIQRDIDDIRNFLYESKDWIGIENEITYDYKSESYTLRHNENEKDHHMYDILASLYATTPTLSRYFYQYLKLLITQHHSDNQATLLKYLRNFEVDDSKPVVSSLSLAFRALNEHKYLQYNRNLLLPLAINYQRFSFYLVYELNKNVRMTDINKMALTLTNKTFDEQQQPTHYYITFEIDRDVWSEIHRYYHIHVVESYDENNLIVTFKMTRFEAIELCFMYRSSIRIIAPSELKEEVIDELLRLQSTYLKQHIHN